MDISAVYFYLATRDVITILDNIFGYQELYLEDLKKLLFVLNEVCLLHFTFCVHSYNSGYICTLVFVYIT